jgi:hypothetical protein
MRHDDTLTASARTGARPRVESTPIDHPRASRQGDFAAGLRTRPLDDRTQRSFATGATRALSLGARPIGDFACGARSPSRPRVTGDFATGMTAPTNGQPRHRAGDRSGTEPDHRGARWATA